VLPAAKDIFTKGEMDDVTFTVEGRSVHTNKAVSAGDAFI
jgi:hypothetical protein